MSLAPAGPILLTSTSATEALSGLYRALRDTDPKYSLTWLCQKAGIKSKGYLADVISGRRKLGLAYRETVAAALGLTGNEAAHFVTLVELDHTTDARRSLALHAELDRYRKVLQVVDATPPASLSISATALEVFSAFGLFRGEGPTREQLAALLPGRRQQDVDRALSRLVAGGYVACDGGRYRLVVQEIRFRSTPSAAKTRIFKELLEQATDSVDTWLEKRDLAHYESAVISVKRDDYRRALDRVREALLELQSSMEAPEADMLVRFNAQIFPLGGPFAAANETCGGGRSRVADAESLPL